MTSYERMERLSNPMPRGLKILLVNVDSNWNVAIRRMYNYFRTENEVDMKDLGFSGYPHNKHMEIDASRYDRVYISNIFDNNKERVSITGCDWIEFGGIGSICPDRHLPPEIENTDPFYYDHEDTSVGFITRGCIRKCWFCKVPKYEGILKVYNDVEKIVKHEKVKFLDNNILAYDRHCEVFQWLIDHNIRCEFNQGLDFRLVNDENMELLSKLRYMGDYIFAFDDPRYKEAIEEKLIVIKRWISQPWKIKFYLYYNPSMEISGLIDRIEWCRENQCKPYIMRDRTCWDCDKDIKNLLTDLAAYCNQPNLFKKMPFEEFLLHRHTNLARIDASRTLYDNARRESK